MTDKKLAGGNFTSFGGYGGYDDYGNYGGTSGYDSQTVYTDPAVLQGNDLPFYTARDSKNNTWTIFLRGEHFPAIIDTLIAPFDVAKDLVNRYNACINWYMHKPD